MSAHEYVCAVVGLEGAEAICSGLLRPVTGPFHAAHSLIDVETHKSCKKRRGETNCELCFHTVLCLMAALREHGILTLPAGGEKVTWRRDGGKDRAAASRDDNSRWLSGDHYCGRKHQEVT